MKIKEIHIHNFRSIEQLHLTDLHPSCNLVVGVNGVGKSSLLDSIAILLSWLIARMKSPTARGVALNDADIRLHAHNGCQLSLETDNQINWSICKQKSFSSRPTAKACQTDLTAMTPWAEHLVEQGEAGHSIPVLMYYPVERAVAAAPVNLHRQQPAIWDVYKEALSGNANFRSLFEWYRLQEDIENELIRDQPDYRDRNLEAVRRAIQTFFPDFSELRVRRRPRQAMVVTKGKETIEFTQLSQGEKCYLALVCDIARRLAIANPQTSDPLQGEGIVLIDEVDLHLHPQWQREIASKLTEVFPNCQFFLSTHSPLVLSDITKQQIIPLQNGNLLHVSFDPFGQLSGSIMTHYFDLPQPRNKAVACKLEEAFDAVRQGNVEQWKTLYRDLQQSIGTADKDMVNLIIEAKRRGMI